MPEDGVSVRDGAALHSGRRGEEAMPALLIATISGIALCLLGPSLVFVLLPVRPHWDTETVLAISVIVITGARFSWLLGQAEPRLMEFSFLTFTYVFMGLAPLIQMQSGRYPGTTPDLSMSLNFTAILIVLVGTISVYFGSTLHRRTADRKPIVSVTETRVLLLALLALGAAAYYLIQVGPANLLSSRERLFRIEDALWPNSTTLSIIRALCTMPLLVAWLGLVQVRRQRRQEAKRMPVVLPAIVCIVLLFVVNPISSPRYLVGTVVLSVLAGIGAYATKRRIRWMTTAFLLGLIFLFPVADAFRREGSPNFSELGVMASLTSGDFDAFAQVNNTVNYVLSEGITWGRQALGVLLFWIPRSWWPEKPLDTGVLLARYRGYQFENLSAPAWSELFINGGWLALIGGMLALGIYIRKRDEFGIRLMNSGQYASVFGTILPFYMFILLRGSLLQAMANLVVILICAVFITKRKHLSQEASSG